MTGDKTDSPIINRPGELSAEISQPITYVRKHAEDLQPRMIMIHLMTFQRRPLVRRTVKNHSSGPQAVQQIKENRLPAIVISKRLPVSSIALHHITLLLDITAIMAEEDHLIRKSKNAEMAAEKKV